MRLDESPEAEDAAGVAAMIMTTMLLATTRTMGRGHSGRGHSGMTEGQSRSPSAIAAGSVRLGAEVAYSA